jgi:hypothetical protein
MAMTATDIIRDKDYHQSYGPEEELISITTSTSPGTNE